MQSEIKAWKANGMPYRQGVSLYMRFGRNDLVKKMLGTEGETPFKRKKLLEEIDKLTAPEETQVQVHHDEIKLAQAQSAAGFFKMWPESSVKDDIEKSLWIKANRLLKEIADMHSQLTHMPNDEERGRMAFAILNLDDELDKIYQNRDYYLTHGQLPSAPGFEVVTDPKAIAKRIVALQRYIRREKQSLETNPENTEAAARLQRWLLEYKQYTND